MITAKEALSATVSLVELELDKVERDIRFAAKHGQTEIGLYLLDAAVRKKVIRELKQHGFLIKSPWLASGIYYVSWTDAK